MPNKHDLKTVFQSLTANAEDAVVIAEVSTVSAVPTGKTRFLTYLKIERTLGISAEDGATGLTAVMASVATASNLSSPASAVVAGKLYAGLAGVSASTVSTFVPIVDASVKVEIPETGPDMENPIISVAGGSCMVLHVNDGGPAAQLIAQYYDE